jgi:hypothetical protein
MCKPGYSFPHFPLKHYLVLPNAKGIRLNHLAPAPNTPLTMITVDPPDMVSQTYILDLKTHRNQVRLIKMLKKRI